MLILSRKMDEDIVIATDPPVRIRLTEIRTMKQVRLGVIVPDHIKVYRGEIWARVEAERKAALNSTQNR